MKKILTSLGCALLFTMGAYSADTVPWSEDFSSSLNISSWKKTAYNSSSKGFGTSSGALYLAEGVSNVNIHNEAWICFTGDGFQLEKGRGYKFEMTARTNSTSETAENNFRVMLIRHVSSSLPSNLGEAQTTVVGATGSSITNYIGTPIETIISYDNLRGEDFRPFSGFFEVPEDGVYDICLYVYTPSAHSSNTAKSRALYFDDFKLSYGSMDAPDVPAMTITPDASGILKADVKVTAPTRSIRGDLLSAITKIEVYRDGGVAKEFTTCSPGQTLTFTDYVAQPGNHNYSVIAYNSYGPGQAFELQTAIGGLPETQTWDNNTYGPYWAKYTPDGKVRIEFPRVTTKPTYNTIEVADENLTYKVQTTSGRVITGELKECSRVTQQISQNPDYEIQMYYIIDDAFDAGSEPIGWQYKISTIENGIETHRGYTNYICLNNQVPYYPNMQTTTSLQAFTADCDYSYGWQYMSGGGGHLSGSASRPYGYSDKNYFYIDWLISPGIILYKDKFYRVKVTSCSDNGVVTYTIKAGKGSYREALDIVVTEDHPTVKGDSNMSTLQTDEMFMSVPEDGQYFVGLMPVLPNSSANTTFRMRRFDIIEVDPTLPDAPTDVKVVYSSTGGSGGKVTFKVPSKAINGDNVKGLTKIEVYKDGEPYTTITNGITPGADLSFDVSVTAGQQNVYAIRAYNAAGQGESASATVFVLSTPYSNDFSSKNSLQGFTLINNLNNGQDFHIQSEQVRLFYSDMGNDHWLIMPPITLTAGQYYQFNYNLKANADEAGEAVVMMGKAPSPDALTEVITPTFEINSEQNIFNGLHEEWFTVEESGQYFIGFHITKPEGRHTKEIYIDDLYIASGVSGTVPDKGILKVTPDPDGALTAELSYTVPTKSLNGAALNANSTQSVYFYINDVQTGGIQEDGTENPSTRTFNAYPGQTVSIKVKVPEDLPYIFSARAGYNGRLTYTDAFVGINRPAYPDPSTIQLVETLPYGHVKLSWDAVTKDVEGYDLNPDNLVYEVMSLVPSVYNPETLVEQPILTDIKGTSCEFDAVSPEAAQTMKRFVLRARNSRGEGSQGVLTKYINVGKPYHMPYRESFGTDKNNPGAKTAIYSEVLEGVCNWGIMTDGLDSNVKSSDGDGCYAAMEALFLESKGRLFTGKINLGSSDKPCLTFMVFNPTQDGSDALNLIQPMIYTHHDGKWHEVAEARTVSELTNNRPGWSKVSYDLSEYTDNVVICAIDATCMRHTFTSIDNVRVWEMPENDLALMSHDAPVSIAPGVPFEVNVNISNSGTKPVTPTNVEMYLDGELVHFVPGFEIDKNEIATVSFSHSIPVVDIQDTHELKFKLNNPNDCDDTDNELSAIVSIVNTHLPGVENLKGNVEGERKLTLTWDAPAISQEPRVTENFENWTAGKATQYGWTSYDKDGRNIIGINDGTGNAVVVPGLPAFEPASFAVIDTKNGPLGGTVFEPYSGDKCLLSLIPSGQSGKSDDWFISPLLSGDSQTVKFAARNYSYYPARIEVLYSEGSMSLDNFQSIATGQLSGGEWQDLSVTLPAGARRFALRNVSYCEESYLLMIDDITYEPATGSDVDVTGYNIYNNKTCIATSYDNSYTFPGSHDVGEYIYGVSACYANGESKVVPVNVLISGVGVEEISIADGVYVFGGNGCIHITNAEGMDVHVYDINGHVVASGQVPASGRLNAAKGIYVVVVGDTTERILVK